MKEPNSYNAIDTVKGMLFQENKEEYKKNQIAFTKKYAFESRVMFFSLSISLSRCVRIN